MAGRSPSAGERAAPLNRPSLVPRGDCGEWPGTRNVGVRRRWGDA
ncbi:MAG: hypothetical protein AVDCRST_MAG19-736 [uncultured Thermomicrobiales bacterium]|uniref:Uncharacterized protein n=1 Tax=uncultured Thermomicrobiales bacterium TaxID=1645740 RepID=A0A6J4UK87_9BACT|nr:MAG: hypothetical protein AVDCRST_MAG19-736 [uncultured Thermomicrobiales bacterium]